MVRGDFGNGSRQEILEVLKQAANKRKDEEKVLLTVRKIKSKLEVSKDITISEQTIRDRGISMDGYFMEKYPDSFDYNKKGDPKNWGLVMYPNKFLQAIEEEATST